MLAAVVAGTYKIMTTQWQSNDVIYVKAKKPDFHNFQQTSTIISEPEVTIPQTENLAAVKASDPETKLAAGAKVDSADQTVDGTFEEGQNKIFFEQINGYLGQGPNDNAKNTPKVTFRPDLSYSKTVIGNGSGGDDKEWGTPCNDDIECTDCGAGVATNYMGVGFTAPSCRVNLRWDKSYKLEALSDASQKHTIYSTDLDHTTWPLNKTSVVGMSPDSDWINYVTNNYNLPDNGIYKFSFFYDV
jgi:hypothetical protein